MATIVLVHGIDNQRETPDLIEASWLPALAGSVRLAGRGDVADRLWPPRCVPNSIECRAAFYGSLFRSPDIQGSRDDRRELSPDQQELADALAVEWLARVTQRVSRESPEYVQARLALEIVQNPDRAQAMGRGNTKREFIKTLAHCSWIAKIGMHFAERYYNTALVQVTRYLTDPRIREQAQKAVLNLVDKETRVIIGHSLGSVVAYECAHSLTSGLPLLVTLGSPLGLETVVTDRLCPPPAFPPAVVVWMNVANLEDPVAAEPDLRPLFTHNAPTSSKFENVRFEEACQDPHRAESYLGRISVGSEVIKVVT